jgi:hypothetical protein
MGDFAVPTSQQHMTAGFWCATMEDVVLASTVRFLFVDAGLLCLDLSQSMLTKIMCAPAVLCSSGPVPCSVAADDVNTDDADHIALLVE